MIFLSEIFHLKYLFSITLILESLMVLKSSFKFFWLIFLSLPFSQENIWENAEDFIQSYFEPEEFYSSDYIQRI